MHASPQALKGAGEEYNHILDVMGRYAGTLPPQRSASKCIGMPCWLSNGVHTCTITTCMKVRCSLQGGGEHDVQAAGRGALRPAHAGRCLSAGQHSVRVPAS